jgi:hypothetical protein
VKFRFGNDPLPSTLRDLQPMLILSAGINFQGYVAPKPTAGHSNYDGRPDHCIRVMPDILHLKTRANSINCRRCCMDFLVTKENPFPGVLFFN